MQFKNLNTNGEWELFVVGDAPVRKNNRPGKTLDMSTKQWNNRGVEPSPQTTMEGSMEESIETLEERLLQGLFRDALASANCRLRSLPVQSETSLPVGSHEFRSFSLWSKSFRLKIHFKTMESDRVGAVALQSWYELWKQEQEQEEALCLNNNSISL